MFKSFIIQLSPSSPSGAVFGALGSGMTSTANFSTGLLVLYFLKVMCLCSGEAAKVSK